MRKGSIFIVITSVLILLGGIWFWNKWFSISVQEEMYVRNLSWNKQVQEYEEYSTYECDDDGCKWVTKTRTLNTWNSSGNYPKDPHWPEYNIRSGNYKRTSEGYRIDMCMSDECYWKRLSWNDYQKFKPEQVCLVTVNPFNFILAIEDCKWVYQP